MTKPVVLTNQNFFQAFGKPKILIYPDGTVIPSESLSWSIKVLFFKAGAQPGFLT